MESRVGHPPTAGKYPYEISVANKVVTACHHHLTRNPPADEPTGGADSSSFTALVRCLWRYQHHGPNHSHGDPLQPQCKPAKRALYQDGILTTRSSAEKDGTPISNRYSTVMAGEGGSWCLNYQQISSSKPQTKSQLYYLFSNIAVIFNVTGDPDSFIALSSTPFRVILTEEERENCSGFAVSVQLVVIILVAYANGYVMKNRSRTGTLQCSGNGWSISSSWPYGNCSSSILTVGVGLGFGTLVWSLDFRLCF